MTLIMSKQRYEGLLVLDTGGNDEKAGEIIDRIQSDFTTEGAEVEQVQKLERRNFSYVAGKLSSGYYANFIFTAEPDVIDKLRIRFVHDPQVYRQHYFKAEKQKAGPSEN